MTRVKWSHAGAALGSWLVLTSPCQGGQSVEQPNVVELRQYTLRPGQRDVLIDLFEREFIESQESLGIRILGTFRDLDKPDRFVWLRGFRDMASRGDVLKTFYEGPVWQAHRTAANATMVDSDNVLLLRVAHAGSGFTPRDADRAPKGAAHIPPGMVVATIYHFERPVESGFADFFEKTVTPELTAAGVTVRASYASETSPNNFPRLPVREGDHVFVWFSVFQTAADYERCLGRLEQSRQWQTIARELYRRVQGAPEVLRLQPTPRSQLHY